MPRKTGKRKTTKARATRKPKLKKKADPEAKSGSEESKILAAISYIIGIFAIIIYFAKEEDRYVRKHAIQAVAWGILVIIAWIVVAIIAAILGLIPLVGPTLAEILWALFWIAAIIATLVFAVWAYQGKEFKIPWLTDRIKGILEKA